MNTHTTTTATKVERLILVHVALSNKHATSEDLLEFQQLAQATGAVIAAVVTVKRDVPDAKYFIGSGKVVMLREQVVISGVTLIIFNHSLSPAQERNLENVLQCRVLDRTGLILDIFAQRARTFEGKLQVELAQLEHLAARLKRGWTHLERQRGGIGLRGPGEKQLEVDRRLVKQRVAVIEKRLEKVRNQRQQSQRARKRADLLIVAIIGYTNAGKSTLFNRLTKSSVYVADKLFATLDPTLRKLYLPEVGEVVVADTVGFVRHLPHELIDAFRATLEETQDADLLLHVVDASEPQHMEKIVAVEEVLQQIGAAAVPQLLVYNKIDLFMNSSDGSNTDGNRNGNDGKNSSNFWENVANIENNENNNVILNADTTLPTTARIDYDEHDIPRRVWLSAMRNDVAELPLLSEAIAKNLLVLKKK